MKKKNNNLKTIFIIVESNILITVDYLEIKSGVTKYFKSHFKENNAKRIFTVRESFKNRFTKNTFGTFLISAVGDPFRSFSQENQAYIIFLATKSPKNHSKENHTSPFTVRESHSSHLKENHFVITSIVRKSLPKTFKENHWNLASSAKESLKNHLKRLILK